jgi:hypothetical protein
MTFIVDVIDMLQCQQFLIGYCKIPLQKEVSIKRLIGVPPSYANGGAAPESATACRWRGGALLCRCSKEEEACLIWDPFDPW